MNLIKVLKALADENRLRILNLLNQKELCVCELESILKMTQSNVSRHLVKLRDAEIINYEKSGQFVFYKINQHMEDEFPCFSDLLNKELIKLRKLQEDLKKFNELSESGLMCIRESCK